MEIKNIVVLLLIIISSNSVNMDFVINGDFSYNLCPKTYCIWNTTTYNSANIYGWIPQPQIQIGKGNFYSANLGNDKVLELAGSKNTCVKQIVQTLNAGSYNLTVFYTAHKNKKFNDCQFTIYFNGKQVSTILPSSYELTNKVFSVKLATLSTKVELKFCGSGTFRNDGLGAILTKVMLQGQSGTSLRKQTSIDSKYKISPSKQIAYNPVNLLQNGNLSQNQCTSSYCIWNTTTFKSSMVPGWQPNPQIQIGYGNIYNSKMSATKRVFQLAGNKDTCVQQTLSSLTIGSYQLYFDWALRTGVKFSDMSFDVYLNDILIESFSPRDYQIHQDLVDFNTQKILTKPIIKFCGHSKNSKDTTLSVVVTNFRLFQLDFQKLQNTSASSIPTILPIITSIPTITSIPSITTTTINNISTSTILSNIQTASNLSTLTQITPQINTELPQVNIMQTTLQSLPTNTTAQTMQKILNSVNSNITSVSNVSSIVTSNSTSVNATMPNISVTPKVVTIQPINQTITVQSTVQPTIANISTVQPAIANISTVQSKIANISTVQQTISNISTVQPTISNISTVQPTIANSTTAISIEQPTIIKSIDPNYPPTIVANNTNISSINLLGNSTKTQNQTNISVNSLLTTSTSQNLQKTINSNFSNNTMNNLVNLSNVSTSIQNSSNLTNSANSGISIPTIQNIQNSTNTGLLVPLINLNISAQNQTKSDNSNINLSLSNLTTSTTGNQDAVIFSNGDLKSQNGSALKNQVSNNNTKTQNIVQIPSKILNSSLLSSQKVIQNIKLSDNLTTNSTDQIQLVNQSSSKGNSTKNTNITVQDSPSVSNQSLSNSQKVENQSNNNSFLILNVTKDNILVNQNPLNKQNAQSIASNVSLNKINTTKDLTKQIIQPMNNGTGSSSSELISSQLNSNSSNSSNLSNSFNSSDSLNASNLSNNQTVNKKQQEYSSGKISSQDNLTTSNFPLSSISTNTSSLQIIQSQSKGQVKQPIIKTLQVQSLSNTINTSQKNSPNSKDQQESIKQSSNKSKILNSVSNQNSSKLNNSSDNTTVKTDIASQPVNVSQSLNITQSTNVTSPNIVNSITNANFSNDTITLTNMTSSLNTDSIINGSSNSQIQANLPLQSTGTKKLQTQIKPQSQTNMLNQTNALNPTNILNQTNIINQINNTDSNKLTVESQPLLNFVKNGDFQTYSCLRLPCYINSTTSSTTTSLSSWISQPQIQFGYLNQYNYILNSSNSNVGVHLGLSNKNTCIKQSLQGLTNQYYDLLFDFAPILTQSSNKINQAYFIVKFNGRNIKNILPINTNSNRQNIVIKGIKGQNILQFCSFGSLNTDIHGSIIDNVSITLKSDLSGMKSDFITNGDFEYNSCTSKSCIWNKQNFNSNYLNGWLPVPQIQIGKGTQYNSHAGISTVAELSPNQNSCIKQIINNCVQGSFKLQFSWAANQGGALHDSILQVKMNDKVFQSYIPNDYMIHREVVVLNLKQGNNELQFCSYGYNNSRGAILDDVRMYLIDSCKDIYQNLVKKQLQI